MYVHRRNAPPHPRRSGYLRRKSRCRLQVKNDIGPTHDRTVRCGSRRKMRRDHPQTNAAGLDLPLAPQRHHQIFADHRFVELQCRAWPVG